MVTLAAFLLFAAAVAAIFLSTFFGLRMAGAAMKRRLEPRERAKRAALAALTLLGGPLAAGAGFAGIGALLYWAQTHPAPAQRPSP